MTIRFWFLCLLSSALIFVSGCEKTETGKVDQNDIFTEFDLAYSVSENKTYARSSFKYKEFTGDKLKLTKGAEVSFNGEVLQWLPDLEYYEYVFGGFIQSGTFLYVDAEGKNYENTIAIEEVRFPIELDTLDLTGNSFDLSWTGNPVGVNQSIRLTVIDPFFSPNSRDFTAASEGMTFFNIKRNNLLHIGPTPVRLNMSRTTNGTFGKVTEAGGLLQGHYSPEDLTIELIF